MKKSFYQAPSLTVDYYYDCYDIVTASYEVGDDSQMFNMDWIGI